LLLIKSEIRLLFQDKALSLAVGKESVADNSRQQFHPVEILVLTFWKLAS